MTAVAPGYDPEILTRQPKLRHFLRPRPVGTPHPVTSTISYVVLVLGVIVAVGPFLYILSTSFKHSSLLFQYPPQWIPPHLYWGNYSRLLSNTLFLRWLANTVGTSLVVTAAKLVLDSMAAYAFSKLSFAGKNVLFILVVATLMIPFSAILVPLYFMVRDFGLLNTYWALILPALASPIGIFLLRGFMDRVPRELDQSARLDGASEWRIYWHVVLPLVRPGLVVLAIFTFLLQYTSFLWPLVSVTDAHLYLVTVGLATQRSITTIDYGALSAGAVMALVPITVFFIALQRYFIAGSLAGAIKG